MRVLDVAQDSHLVILLAEGITLRYKGIYYFTQDCLQRAAGKGPAVIEREAIASAYKYSSAQRKFVALHGLSTLGSTTDAVSVDPKFIRQHGAKRRPVPASDNLP